MKILILGADGMLGHVVATYLTEKGHEVVKTSRDPDDNYYYDAYENVYGIEGIIARVHPDAIINCIGILNEAAEKHHALAILLNSFLPNFLDTLSEKYRFTLVHITTDCVFDGENGNYTEDSVPNATSFYGISKAMGEVRSDRTLTLRLSIVGPDINPGGIGLFNWFSKQSGEVKGYSEVYWTGVTTIELARVIEEALQKKITGFHHVVNNEKIKKSELIRLFEKYFHFGITVIDDNTKKSDKSLVRTSKSYDFKIPSYEQMVKDMRAWVDAHPDLYTDLKERMDK